jgi:hypothetical protein
MKILICCFLIVFYSANSNDDEISLYNFVLDEMVKIYSIDSIILMSEQCYWVPIVTQGLTLDETMANIKEALSLHLEDEDL